MAGAEQNEPKGGTVAQLAKSAALHLMQVLRAATVYLGRNALDLIDAVRRALLLRNRRKFPERAAKIDSVVAILRDREAQRWSSWATVAVGRRTEVRAAALAIVIGILFVTYAWLNRGRSSPEQLAYQLRTAHAPSSRSPQGAPSIAAPSAAPTVNLARLDAEHFAEYRKQAAPGQWIVYGVEPVERARANLAKAQAQSKSAHEAFLAAFNKADESHSKENNDYSRRESLVQQHASQDALHEADRIYRADQATADADTAGANAANDEDRAKDDACQAAQAELNNAKNPVVRPVLERGRTSEWDGFKVMSPVVMKEGSRYRMWYVGCHFVQDEYSCGVGHAQSRDGVSWEKSPGRPVLAVGDPQISQNLSSIAVVRTGKEYLLWYSFGENRLYESDCATLNLATSKDGLVWKPQGLVFSANCDQDAYLWQSAFYDGSAVHLWYSDYDSSPNGSLVHLSSADGRAWQKAGSADLGSLGFDPRRLWVVSNGSGYRALFAAPAQKGYFGMLRSADGNSWKISDAPGNLTNVLKSGDYGTPETPTAVVEPEGTWLWFAVPSTRDGSKSITVAYRKGPAQ